MKYVAAAAVYFVLFAVTGAFAQSVPTTELFAGFSTLRYPLVGGGSVALNGWNLSATGNINSRFAFTGEAGGSYAEFARTYTFLVGPTLTLYRRQLRKNPSRNNSIFTHALFGGDHASENFAAAPDTSWAMAIGAGTEVGFTRLLGLRLCLDWLRTNNFSVAQNSARFTAGVVFNVPSGRR